MPLDWSKPIKTSDGLNCKEVFREVGGDICVEVFAFDNEYYRIRREDGFVFRGGIFTDQPWRIVNETS